MMIHLRHSSLFIILFSFFVFSPHSIHAQQFSFSLAPQKHHIITQPGTSIALPYSLTNLGDPTVLRLESYVLRLTDSAGSYDILPFYSDHPNVPAISTLDPTRPLRNPFLLGSRETRDFDIVVDIPADIATGDYYFTLTAEAEPHSGFEEESHISLQGGVGSPLFITVSQTPDIPVTGDIVQFAVKSNNTLMLGETTYVLFDSFEPIPVILSVANTGAHLFETKGTINLKRSHFFPGQVEQYEVTPHMVLSTAQRTLTPTDFHFPSSFFGIYTAQADIEYGRGGSTDSAQLNFIVFPFTILAGFSTIILITLMGFLLWRKKKR